MQNKSLTYESVWMRTFWMFLLVGASIVFTFSFACAASFAAVCAAAVCTLPRRDAYVLAGAVWAANQFVGFAFLHYPWTGNCLAWGAAIGLSALLSTLTGRWAALQLRLPSFLVKWAVVFLAAFIALEAGLLGFSFVLGGLENFTPAIVASVLGINAIASVGLAALHWAGSFVGVPSSYTSTLAR